MTHPIIQYAHEYSWREVIAGRKPTTIRLTREQVEILKKWAEHELFMMDSKGDGKNGRQPVN